MLIFKYSSSAAGPMVWFINKPTGHMELDSQAAGGAV